MNIFATVISLFIRNNRLRVNKTEDTLKKTLRSRSTEHN